MKGLLLKDFYTTKANIFVAFLSCIVMAIGLSVVISPSVVIILITIPLSMTVSSTIISDKKNKWTQFSVTLPVSKKQIISSKYIAYLFWTIIGVIVGNLICYIILAITNVSDTSINIFTGFSIIFSIIIALLSGSIIMPCNFILPEEKSIIGTILAYSLTSGFLALSIFALNQIFNVRDNMTQTLIICSVISLIVFIISWIVSSNKIKNFN